MPRRAGRGKDPAAPSVQAHITYAGVTLHEPETGLTSVSCISLFSVMIERCSCCTGLVNQVPLVVFPGQRFTEVAKD